MKGFEKNELCGKTGKRTGPRYGESEITVVCDLPKDHLPADTHSQTITWRTWK